MKSRLRMAFWAVTALLAMSFAGCAANLYFPADSFADGVSQRSAMYAHMLRNLNAVLANPRLHAAIRYCPNSLLVVQRRKSMSGPARGSIPRRVPCPGRPCVPVDRLGEPAGRRVGCAAWRTMGALRSALCSV